MTPTDHIVVDPLTQVVAMMTAMAVTGGLFAQIVLQLMARRDAARREVEGKQAAEAKSILDSHTAEKTAKAVEGVRLEAVKAASAVEDVKQHAALAVQAAEDVRTTLASTTQATDAKLNGLGVIAAEAKLMGERNHVLLNSGFTAQLRATMIALKRLAEVTHNPEDIEAARLAEKLLIEHESKQEKLNIKDAELNK